jgi:hypothetical protein
MRFLFTFLLLIGFGSSDVDLGLADKKTSPSAKELTPPKSADGVTKVDLRATVTGKVSKNEKRNIYIVVNPLSNSETKDTWWVQEEVTRDGENYSGSCQFGEMDAGAGEFFALVGVVKRSK